MKSIQISNKFKNLSILLLAKEEHKRKFSKSIIMRNYSGGGITRSIKYQIEKRLINHNSFILKLTSIIQSKSVDYAIRCQIEKMRNEIITTTPSVEEQLTEYNPDECCPVCFETFGIFEDDATIAEGQNCNHIICRECYEKIVDDTNRCPICRAVLDYDFEKPVETETDDDDSYNSEETDEDEFDFGNDNQRPTERLFVGRRWFNTQTNTIEYYDGSSWTETFVRFDTMFRFLMRNMGFNNNGLLEDCCQTCGIQKTTEVNDYMNDGRLGTLREGNFFYYGDCYTCHAIYTNLENHFNNMEYPYSINTTSYDTASLYPYPH